MVQNVNGPSQVWDEWNRVARTWSEVPRCTLSTYYFSIFNVTFLIHVSLKPGPTNTSSPMKSIACAVGLVEAYQLSQQLCYLSQKTILPAEMNATSCRSGEITSCCSNTSLTVCCESAAYRQSALQSVSFAVTSFGVMSIYLMVNRHYLRVLCHRTLPAVTTVYCIRCLCGSVTRRLCCALRTQSLRTVHSSIR